MSRRIDPITEYLREQAATVAKIKPGQATATDVLALAVLSVGIALVETLDIKLSEIDGTLRERLVGTDG